MKGKLLLSSVALIMSSFIIPNGSAKLSPNADKIVGTWVTTTKDLWVDVYKQGSTFSGKITDYTCGCDEGTLEKGKRHRAHAKCKNYWWKNTKVMWNLKYANGNTWDNGEIKDLNSGRVYSSVVRYGSNDKLEVRGYWAFEWIGQSLYFTRP